MKQVNIPARWSGEQALDVVTFLQAVISAIWQQHGERMTEYIDFLGAPPPPTDDPRFNDDELPF